MPRRPMTSRDAVVSAAIQIIQKDGANVLSIRSVAELLGILPSSVLVHFKSLDELKDAALEAVKETYDKYVESGFSTPLPLKEFSLRFLHFAKENPNIFMFIFSSNQKGKDLYEFLTREGHSEMAISILSEKAGISPEQAELFHRYVMVYVYGLSMLIARGLCCFTDEEILHMLLDVCRSIMFAVTSPDELPKFGGG